MLKMLRNALLAWNASVSGQSPEKILYLLEHQYSQANLRGSALKGKDAQHVALMESLAQELGFCLGLASAECHLSGSADDERSYGGWGGRRRGCFYDEDDEDEERVSFAEIEEREMKIMNLVDLDGNVLSKKLKIGKRTHTIPANLEQTITAGSHDDQEYEGYMGNVSKTRFMDVYVMFDHMFQGAGSLERCE